MGNCQAIDAAALIIQHPNGKFERMYWPIIANEVMKMNPGFHVSLIIPETEPVVPAATGKSSNTGRYTRVKLLRPTDTLVLGRAYRLVTAQEVKKVLRAKRMAKAKMNELGLAAEKLDMSQSKDVESLNSENNNNQVSSKPEKQRLRSGSMNSRSKTWQPSLLSISEDSLQESRESRFRRVRGDFPDGRID